MKKYNVVGSPVIKADSYDKAVGLTKYIADIKLPDMAYGKILHSQTAHAIIESIDISEALSLPGVFGIITYEDAPDIPYTTCGHPRPFDTPLDSHILNKHVRYIGDPIAAVAAKTPELAQEAIEKIKCQYKLLPSYFTPSDALKEDSVEIHTGTHNITGESEFQIGDTENAFQNAAYIFQDEFDTPIVTHSQIETHVSLVEENPSDHRLIVHAATQVPSIMRERIAYALGRSMRDIRIIKGTVGGGFGGKQEPVFEIINCLLTMKAKRPVLLESTREECLSMTRTRHSMHILLRSALDKNFKFIGRDISILSNGGAYSSHGHNVALAISVQAGMLYPTENLHFKAVTAYTNILIAGAMRGYGMPQWTFAMESHVDNIAKALHIDPYKFREINIYKKGDPIYMQNIHVNSCALPQMMREGASDIGWPDFKKPVRTSGKKKRGIGMACCSYGQGCYPYNVELSNARIKMHEDGTVSLMCGCGDVGQGIDTGLSQIAAEAVGVPYDWVRICPIVDTDISPFDPGAYASRELYASGMAVKKAGEACKKDILEFACRTKNLEMNTVDLWNGFLIQKKDRKPICPIEELTMNMYYHTPDAQGISHEEYSYPTDNTLTFGAAFAIVEVDVSTGEVTVEKLRTYLDCGTVVNPLIAKGQLTGGCVMSYGFALMEQIIIDPKSGRVLNDNLLDYKIPTMADYPNIDGGFFESEEPTSAYGNKSLGEPPNLAPAAAIRNAIVDATGIPMNSLPLTPEKVWEYLHPLDID